jgi:hypothetical protein
VTDRLERWWRYPYAVAGPLSVLLFTGSAVAGAVEALALRPPFQQAGAVFTGAGFVALTLARRRFVKRRGITYFRMPGLRSKHGVAGLVMGLAAIAVIGVVHLNFAWYWPFTSVAVLAYEFDRRQAWAKLGWAGDPRWAKDWSPEIDPVYDLRAIPPMQAKEYREARSLLERGLQEGLHGWRLSSALYHLACIEALSGERDAALEHLNAAVAVDDDLVPVRELARKDADFATIRDDPRFPVAGSP